MSNDNYFSRENRLARRARRIASYDSLSGIGRTAERRLTTQNASQYAVKMAREVLDNFRLPTMPKLSYSGMRSASTATDSTKLEDGVITIFAELKTLSGVNIGFDMPIEIRAGEILEPSVVVVEGAPRIIAQSTFDDIVERATIYDERPVRDLYSPPMPAGVASDLYANRSKTVRVNNGMFSMGANRQAIRDAIAGRSASLKVASPEDYDSDTEHELPDTERNQQDDDWLDPAERIDQNDLCAGQEVSLKETLEVGDRGGGKYEFSKGTKCKILRDHAGDNKSFVVRFEDGVDAIVERHFLKSSGKNPPVPKAPSRTKNTTPKAPSMKQPKNLLKKKQPKLCPKCNSSPCVCHRKKSQISFPNQFPKKCKVCGAVYNSMADWQKLPPPVTGKTEWITDFEDYDVRNCACGSTLAVIVNRKVEDPELDNYLDDGEHDAALPGVQVEDVDKVADSELVAKVNEEVGSLREQGLSDADVRQAVQSKYGSDVYEAVFTKTAP